MNVLLKSIILILTLVSSYLYCQDFDTVVRTYGPYCIDVFDKHSVYVDVHTIESKGSNYNYPKSDVSIVVRDTCHKILYRRNFPFTTYDEFTIVPQQRTIQGKGNCLLIMIESTPSAPGSGLTGQFYCINKYNQFVPITGLLTPSIESMAQDNFKIVKRKKRGPHQFFIEIPVWTGSFYILDYYTFNFNGQFGDWSNSFNFGKNPIKIDSVEAEKTRKAMLIEPAFINLYTNTILDEGSFKTVKVDKESKVKFLHAKRSGGKFWLYIQIDEINGYVKGAEDFIKLGLPLAG